MSNEVLRKAVAFTEDLLAAPVNSKSGCFTMHKGDWQTIKQALRDQEAEIARLTAANIAYASDNANLQGRAMSAEAEIATHRANHDALVIRLGDVTARLEAADGLLSEAWGFMSNEGIDWRAVGQDASLLDRIDAALSQPIATRGQ